VTLSSRQLGERLCERNVLSRDDLAAYLAREEDEGVPFARLLLAAGLVREEDVLAVVADDAGYRFLDLTVEPPDRAAPALLAAEVARRYVALPVRLEEDRLLVAMADPSDAAAVEAIAADTGLVVVTALASRRAIERALDALYGPTSKPEPPRSPADVPPPSVLGEDGLDALQVEELLTELVERRGSDLHLTTGVPPAVRVDGRILPLADRPVLTPGEVRRMIYAMLTQRQRERFEERHELDTSYSVPGLGRFRVNVFLQRNSLGAVFRYIPASVVPLAELGLPSVLESFAELPRGLVLVTGPTGSGKSTTLASLVDRMNSTRAVHIMTIEDPIEFLHSHKRALVNQREVGEDTSSFAEALRHVLRQDPDIILVGEMRDLETIGAALTAAETGHLVLGTLHTQDAPQSIDRVIDVFPAGQQTQIRVQLASALQAVVTQQLVPLAAGRGRAVAAEVLIATAAVRNLIREGKTHQLYSTMQAGGQYGMQTMDMSLAQLVRQSRVTMAAAAERAVNPDDLRRLVASPA